MLHFMFVVFRYLCKIVLCTFGSADSFFKLLTDCHNLPVSLCGFLMHGVFSGCLCFCCADVYVQETGPPPPTPASITKIVSSDRTGMSVRYKNEAMLYNKHTQKIKGKKET